MVPQLTLLHVSMCAVALAVSRSSSMFASALNVPITDCSDSSALMSRISLTEDVNVYVKETDAFVCDTLTTLTVNGPYKFRIISESHTVSSENVRFVISGGTEFSISSTDKDGLGNAKFSGVTAQNADGGTFHVKNGSSLAFMLPVTFEDNLVEAGHSGGAVYAGGKVDFEYKATFLRNEAMSDADVDAGNGGAVAVGRQGSVTFHDFSSFSGNAVNSGGKGGAIANLGNLNFKRASYFYSNVAKENGDELGGLGGAIYTEGGATTYFKRRTIMRSNEASNGGALYNAGTTELASRGFFRGNQAMGKHAADGGHIFTAGTLKMLGLVNFREGFAHRYGGAIYVAGESTVTAAGTMFDYNVADASCADAVLVEGDTLACQSILP